MERTVSLCYCQFGNYIMQHLIVKGSEKVRTQILSDITPDFINLSNNKFASNVMEKAVINSTATFRETVTDQILNINSG